MTRLIPQRWNAAIMERIGRAQLRMEDGQLYWTEQTSAFFWFEMHSKIVRRGEYGIHPDSLREETTVLMISSLLSPLLEWQRANPLRATLPGKWICFFSFFRRTEWVVLFKPPLVLQIDFHLLKNLASAGMRPRWIIGPTVVPAVLEHNIEIRPVSLRLHFRRSNSFSFLGAPHLIKDSLRVVVTDGSFIRSAEEYCMLACGTVVDPAHPFFFVIKRKTLRPVLRLLIRGLVWSYFWFSFDEKGRGALTRILNRRGTAFWSIEQEEEKRKTTKSHDHQDVHNDSIFW